MNRLQDSNKVLKNVFDVVGDQSTSIVWCDILSHSQLSLLAGETLASDKTQPLQPFDRRTDLLLGKN